VLCSFDSRDHLGIGLIAVAEHGYGATRLRAPLRDAPAGVFEGSEMILASDRRRRVCYPGRRPAASQAPGATPNTVDAQQQVKHAAKNRREPGETDPRYARAAIALVEKYMSRNAGCESDMYQQDDGVAYHAYQTRHAEAKTSIPVSAESVRRSLLSCGNVLGHTVRVRLRAAGHHVRNEMTAKFACGQGSSTLSLRKPLANHRQLALARRAGLRIGGHLDRACRERRGDVLLVTGPAAGEPPPNGLTAPGH
jgi:hypothetical protein